MKVSVGDGQQQHTRTYVSKRIHHGVRCRTSVTTRPLRCLRACISRSNFPSACRHWYLQKALFFALTIDSVVGEESHLNRYESHAILPLCTNPALITCALYIHSTECDSREILEDLLLKSGSNPFVVECRSLCWK